MGGTFNTNIPKSSKVVSLPLIYDMENEANQQVEEKIYLGSYVGRPTHKLRIKLESKLKSNNSFM